MSLCVELARRQCECFDQLPASAAESIVSFAHPNFVKGSRHECSQASVTKSFALCLLAASTRFYSKFSVLFSNEHFLCEG